MYNRKVYEVAAGAVPFLLKKIIIQRWTQKWEKVQETETFVPRIR